MLKRSKKEKTMNSNLKRNLIVNGVFENMNEDTILNPSFFVIGLLLHKAMKSGGIATSHFSKMMKQIEGKIRLRKETLEKV